VSSFLEIKKMLVQKALTFLFYVKDYLAPFGTKAC
jgi:hypothetical protein